MIERVFGSSQARCGVARPTVAAEATYHSQDVAASWKFRLLCVSLRRSQVFAVLRVGSTVPCFVMHQGSERHCVRCDGCSGWRPPDSGAAQNWTRTTKAASHTPSLFSLQCSGCCGSAATLRRCGVLRCRGSGQLSNTDVAASSACLQLRQQPTQVNTDVAASQLGRTGGSSSTSMLLPERKHGPQPRCGQDRIRQTVV